MHLYRTSLRHNPWLQHSLVRLLVCVAAVIHYDLTVRPTQLSLTRSNFVLHVPHPHSHKSRVATICTTSAFEVHEEGGVCVSVAWWQARRWREGGRGQWCGGPNRDLRAASCSLKSCTRTASSGVD
jgi:hypothetical protein